MPAPTIFRAISLFGWKHGHFPVPANFPPAAARSGGPGRCEAPAQTRLALDGRERHGSLRVARTGARLLLAAGVLATATVSTPGDLAAEPAPAVGQVLTVGRAEITGPIDAAIAEASRRFGVPPTWIRAVMRAESGFDPRAISRAGAMGLMQLMPPTWAEWRLRLGLGGDPFDIRDNILAGAGYLRALIDQFGVPGFIAAYNAGPGRYAEHLATGRPLPAETRTYLANVAPRLSGGAPSFDTPSALPDWRRSGLFVRGPSPLLTPSSAVGVQP
ncbi:lytic transglycosylase domain-containing protein [Caulobacter sp. KR2-114]|jgi:soluble lytic murein transglycosylase-like protein|uniref:lytic transglycosylase domain-containing protein n=1 Tax=Caulobacter sp. KR2-114 TaxID=3400912 RepID=UPI003C0B81DD